MMLASVRTIAKMRTSRSGHPQVVTHDRLLPNLLLLPVHVLLLPKNVPYVRRYRDGARESLETIFVSVASQPPDLVWICQ